MQNRTNLIILIIGLLIAFGLGFGIGKSTPLELPESKMSEDQLILDLEGKLESKMEKSLIFLGVAYDDEKTIRASLNGEVIKIEGSTLIVKVANSYQGGKFFEYLDEPDYYQKRVKAEGDTEIVKLISIPPEELLSPSEETFSPFEEEGASFSELKEGMKVSVEAKSEFDLADTDEIFAKRIEIHE